MHVYTHICMYIYIYIYTCICYRVAIAKVVDYHTHLV